MTSVNIDDLDPVIEFGGVVAGANDVFELQQVQFDSVNRKMTLSQLLRTQLAAPVRETGVVTSATIVNTDVGGVLVCQNTSLLTVAFPSDTFGTAKGTITMLMAGIGPVKTVRTVGGVTQAQGLPGGRNAINEQWLAMQWAYVNAATPFWVLSGAVTTL